MDEYITGFAVTWNENGQIQAVIRTISHQWVVAYRLPECTGFATCSPILRWLHVCIVLEKPEPQFALMYVNGLLVNKASKGSTSIAIKGTTMLIQKLHFIRDVRLWDFTLSANDVATIYNESEFKNFV